METRSGLQFKVAYRPAMTVDSAVQLVVAHCTIERTFDPQFAARQTHLCPSQPHYALHPAMFSQKTVISNAIFYTRKLCYRKDDRAMRPINECLSCLFTELHSSQAQQGLLHKIFSLPQNFSMFSWE